MYSFIVHSLRDTQFPSEAEKEYFLFTSIDANNNKNNSKNRYFTQNSHNTNPMNYIMKEISGPDREDSGILNENLNLLACLIHI